jgi:nitrogen fixation protein
MSDRECFCFLSYCWDVTAAKQIAANLPIGRFDPTSWFGWLGAITLDEDHIPTVDLERPIIAVKLADAGGASMIIDGWHRIARAQRDGLTDLPVTVLDEDQERTIRVYGGDLP